MQLLTSENRIFQNLEIVQSSLISLHAKMVEISTNANIQVETSSRDHAVLIRYKLEDFITLDVNAFLALPKEKRDEALGILFDDIEYARENYKAFCKELGNVADAEKKEMHLALKHADMVLRDLRGLIQDTAQDHNPPKLRNVLMAVGAILTIGFAQRCSPKQHKPISQPAPPAAAPTQSYPRQGSSHIRRLDEHATHTPISRA